MSALLMRVLSGWGFSLCEIILDALYLYLSMKEIVYLDDPVVTEDYSENLFGKTYRLEWVPSRLYSLSEQLTHCL